MTEPRNPELAATLIEMGKVDQEMRRAHAEDGAPWDSSIDVEHTERLKGIITKHGWPTVSLVGWEASDCAWLIVQHAAHDVPFMKAVLATLITLPADEETRASGIALLEDRLRMFDGLPQRYGTQWTGTGPTMRPHPIADLERLDEHRAAVGLGPWAEYEAQIRETYGRSAESA